MTQTGATRIRILPSPDRGVFLHREERPALREGFAGVRMTHSLVSPGTERMQIDMVAGKTREQIAASQVSLGYCAAGVVEESRIAGISIGDRVACYGGPYVAHASYIAVPERLAVPMTADMDAGEACFMGLGAISLHGFRMGACGLGDRALVIGAGMVGNLCAQLAMAAGCRVLVTEQHPLRLELMRSLLDANGRHLATEPPRDEMLFPQFTEGHGFDAVYVCVAHATRPILEIAARTVRNGGRVVMLGDGEIDAPRSPFFDTEATISVSRAAGPGRYDPVYEAEGVDYPIQYARWTEGRNIREVLDLLATGILKVDRMISSVYTITKVHDAYKAIHENPEEIGVLLDWTAIDSEGNES